MNLIELAIAYAPTVHLFVRFLMWYHFGFNAQS